MNKLFRKTDKHEEKQGSGMERESGMKEWSCKDRLKVRYIDDERLKDTED